MLFSLISALKDSEDALENTLKNVIPPEQVSVIEEVVHIKASSSEMKTFPTNIIQPINDDFPTVKNFETPKCVLKIAPLSPATIAARMSEIVVAYRLLHSEDNLNLNARSLEVDFTDSPPMKISVSNGRKAKKPWLYGVQRAPRSSFVISKFSNWLLDSKEENITGYLSCSSVEYKS